MAAIAALGACENSPIRAGGQGSDMTHMAVVPMSKHTPTLVFVLMRIFHRPKIGTTARKTCVKADSAIRTRMVSIPHSPLYRVKLSAYHHWRSVCLQPFQVEGIDAGQMDSTSLPAGNIRCT